MMISDENLLPPSDADENSTPQPGKPQGELDDLRASMAEEEQARLKAKKNSGLLKKVTGLLRKQQTGKLDETQPQVGEPATGNPFTGPLDEADILSDEIVQEQVGRAFSGWEEGEEVLPQAEARVEEESTQQPAALTWDENELMPASDLEPQEEEKPAFSSSAFDMTEEEILAASEPVEVPQPETPSAFEMYTGEDDLDLDAGLIGEAFEAETAPAAEAGDQVETPVMEEAGGETAQTENLRAELMPEAEPAEEPARKPTRTLLQRFTGWLNPESVPVEAPADVADDLIADRLQKVHSADILPEIPGTHKIPDYSVYEFDHAADSETDDDELADPFSRLRVEPAPKQPDEPRGFGRESLLPGDWVDRQAHFAAEEPVAEDYAERLAPPVQDENAYKAPSRLSELSVPGSVDEDAPVIEEVRTQVLEDYEDTPAVTIVLPPEPFGVRVRNWGRKNLGVLIALAVMLVAAAIVSVVKPWERPPIALPSTPIPSDMPYPVGLEMTGGWFYDINRSTIINNQWQPQGAEWLDNSQLRRVVALPWNKQSEAVIQTLVRGDQINLVFSNNDLLPFVVRSVDRLDKGDMTLFTENEPGLVIFLYGEESDQRWVVLALPK